MSENFTIGFLVALVCTMILARVFQTRTRLEFRARICEVLAATARRGLPLLPALQAARSDFGGARGRALERTCGALKAGLPLHEACALAGKRFFPRDSWVAMAEGGGSFPAALEAAAVDSERALDLRHRGLLALAYPIVLLAVFPVLLLVNQVLSDTVYGLERADGAPAFWLATTQVATQVVLGAVVSFAAVWLLFGALLPYPGRALFRAERELRSAATSLRAGEDWPPRRSRLPSDLAARMDLAARHAPEQAAETINAIAEECARRAAETARRAMRAVQASALVLIGAVAALQFGVVFMVQRICLEGITPW